MNKMFAEIKENKINEIQSQHKTKNGIKFPVQITSRYLEYNNKEYEFAFVQDITERKRKEKQFQTRKEKIEKMNQALTKITDMTVHALAQNIISIKTPEANVTETAYRADFLNKAAREFFNMIRDTITETNIISELKPVRVECSECNHTFEQGYTMDMTNFFGAAS